MHNSVQSGSQRLNTSVTGFGKRSSFRSLTRGSRKNERDRVVGRKYQILSLSPLRSHSGTLRRYSNKFRQSNTIFLTPAAAAEQLPRLRRRRRWWWQAEARKRARKSILSPSHSCLVPGIVTSSHSASLSLLNLHVYWIFFLVLIACACLHLVKGRHEDESQVYPGETHYRQTRHDTSSQDRTKTTRNDNYVCLCVSLSPVSVSWIRSQDKGISLANVLC